MVGIEYFVPLNWKCKGNIIMATPITGTAKKESAGKLRLDLIPPEVLQVLAEVFEYGASKYGEGNWEQGFPAGQLIGAARRHDLAFVRGGDYDPESGLPHLAHAAVNYLMLETLRMRAIAQDIQSVKKEEPDNNEFPRQLTIDEYLAMKKKILAHG